MTERQWMQQFVCSEALSFAPQQCTRWYNDTYVLNLLWMLLCITPFMPFKLLLLLFLRYYNMTTRLDCIQTVRLNSYSYVPSRKQMPYFNLLLFYSFKAEVFN